jgi:cyanate lyase
MKRTDVTEMVVESRLKKGLSWAKIAKAVGASKEWTTAALLGQMQMTKAQAEAAGSGRRVCAPSR